MPINTKEDEECNVMKEPCVKKQNVGLKREGGYGLLGSLKLRMCEEEGEEDLASKGKCKALNPNREVLSAWLTVSDSNKSL